RSARIDSRLTDTKASAIARSHGHEMTSRGSGIVNKRIATRIAARTRRRRSADSTDAGVLMIAVVIRSAAQRDQAGLDAAATLKSRSRSRVVFGDIGRARRAVETLPDARDGCDGFSQVAPPRDAGHTVCTAATNVRRNNTVLR